MRAPGTAAALFDETVRETALATATVIAAAQPNAAPDKQHALRVGPLLPHRIGRWVWSGVLHTLQYRANSVCCN